MLEQIASVKSFHAWLLSPQAYTAPPSRMPTVCLLAADTAAQRALMVATLSDCQICQVRLGLLLTAKLGLLLMVRRWLPCNC